MTRARVERGRGGAWVCRPYLGTDRVTGKRIRPQKTFPAELTEGEAQAAADRWLASVAPAAASGSGRSLSDMLAGYLRKGALYGLSPSTVATYESAARCYVAPTIGSIPFDELEPWQVSTAWAVLLAGAKRPAVAEATVRKAHAMLSGAYAHWVSERLCRSNPLASVSAPRVRAAEAFALDAADMAKVSAALRSAMGDGDPMRRCCAFLAYVALVTGARCGEVCAVRRRDVNRMARYVHVGGNVIEETGKRPYRREVTKGKRSRNVTVTEHDIAVVTDFMALLDRTLGPFGADSPLVTVDGTYMRPSTVSEAFSAIRDRLGLPKRLTFHGLRHTHATWCLMNGIDVKTLQERLGHASPSITLNTYAHVLPGRDALAATAFEDAARRARGK